VATLNPHGLMPETLIDASQRQAALTWVLLAPHTGAWKIDLWRGWGIETGSRLTADEYNLVGRSGVPTTPVDVPPAVPVENIK
jgi:hypothetical protein